MTVPTNDELKAMTVSQLWNGLREALTLTAEGLQRMAGFYAELKRRGEDLSAYSNPIMNMLPHVADGTLLPEVPIKFGCNVALMTQLATVPIPEQKKLLEDGVKVPVLRRGESGPEIALRQPLAMTAAEVYRVIQNGRVLPPKEQVLPEPIVLPERDHHEIEDWDVYHELTPTQRQQLTEKAGERNLTPAEYIKQLLINHRDISRASVTTDRLRGMRHKNETIRDENRPTA